MSELIPIPVPNVEELSPSESYFFLTSSSLILDRKNLKFLSSVVRTKVDFELNDTIIAKYLTSFDLILSFLAIAPTDQDHIRSTRIKVLTFDQTSQ